MLPTELLCMIFSHLPAHDIISVVPKVCSRWKEIVESAPIELVKRIEPEIQEFALDMCEKGNLPALRVARIYNFNYDKDMFCIVCENGHLEVAKWLTSHFDLTPDNARVNNNHSFHYSCVNGHLEVARWLTSHFDLTRDDTHVDYNYILRDSCKNGHLEIVKWLTSRSA